MEEENIYLTNDEMHKDANISASIVNDLTEEELISFISYLDRDMMEHNSHC